MDEKRQTTRRAFLKGQSAADALLDVTNGAGAASAPADPLTARSAAPYMIHVGRRAMACQFEVFLNAGEHAGGTEAAVAALDLVDSLESQLTVYRQNSELSCINQIASEGFVPVEPRLFALLQNAVQVYRDTDGAYDVTSGPLSKVWGFYRRNGQLPSKDDLQAALAVVGSSNLQFDLNSNRIRFAQAGMEINLGSIGKGYTLDRCAELLNREGVTNFLVHGGQSSVLAQGSQAGEHGWLVGIRHPLRADRRLAEIRLQNRALGTSGSGTQFFFHQGKRYGHILDPRTGMPADKVMSATAIAPTGAEADALSTAFYVMGVEAASQYCSQHPQIAAVIVYSENGHNLKIDSIGLSEHDWRLID